MVRALCSHRRGHWFESSVAHSYFLPVAPDITKVEGGRKRSRSASLGELYDSSFTNLHVVHVSIRVLQSALYIGLMTAMKFVLVWKSECHVLNSDYHMPRLPRTNRLSGGKSDSQVHNNLMLPWILVACLAVTGCEKSDALDRNHQDSVADTTTNATVLLNPNDESRLVRVRVSQFQMGMMVHLTLWAPSIEAGQQAAATAFRRVQQINQIMSDYEPESELSRLCRKAGEGPVQVSPELFEVLATARRLAALTEGRYDPTSGPVTQLWREARRTGMPPEPLSLEKANRLVDYRQILLDPNEHMVELTREGIRLDLGSIAKGYAGDQALKSLREQGIGCAAFEAGGDKVFGDPPPGQIGWLVESPQPDSKPLHLANCAASISGDTVQYLQIDGRRVSHVIDSSTGQGLSSRRMCLTVAPSGLLSDPLATIGTILPETAYQGLLKKHCPEARGYVFPAPAEPSPNTPLVPPP